MKVIGITGGIGAGKSFVCQLIKAKGYPVYNADLMSKELLITREIRPEVERLFGSNAYQLSESGKLVLNTTFIADAIFSNPVLRKQLEQLIHPLVRNDFKSWVMQQSSTLVFQESALLLASEDLSFFDAIVYIDADIDRRIEKVMLRNDLARSEVLDRIAAQPKLEDHTHRIHYLLYNDYDHSIEQEVDALLEDLSLKTTV